MVAAKSSRGAQMKYSQTAHQLMAEDPTIASGLCRGELRGFHVALLRGDAVPGI